MSRDIQCISYSLSNGPNSIEQKQRKINTWLRYHPDYRVVLDFCSIFACLKITIEHHGEFEKLWIGDTLEKRLDEVISYLKIEDRP